MKPEGPKRKRERRDQGTNMRMMEERFQKNERRKRKQGKRVRTNSNEEGTETET
jgi:hypothetical protein